MKGNPLLTVKQERFAQLIATQDISQTAAYIDAGYSSKALRKSLWTLASELAANVKVRRRVQEIRDAARDNAAMTLEKHLADLADIRDGALAGDETAQGNIVKNYGAAVSAEIARGKHSGVAAPDKRMDVTEDVPPEDAIRDLCVVNGILNEIAHRHGLAMLKALRSPAPSLDMTG